MRFNCCPLCESPAISKKKGKRVLQLKQNLVAPPVIEYWECENCGEVFYTHETGKKLDDFFLTKLKRKVG
jgi:YgiT-type zinc finger domain-containing protein